MNYMQPYHDLLLSVHMLAILVDICYTLIDKDNERPELLMYGLYVVYGIIIFTGGLQLEVSISLYIYLFITTY